MGTSTSRRSPRTPRFSAFVAALGGSAGPERAVTELYQAAATTWRAEVAGAAVLPFVAAALDAHGTLAERLATSDPAAAVADLVRRARNEAVHASGGSLAVAIGERALSRLLVETIAGDAGLSHTSREDAATLWAQRRGDVADFGRQMAGQVMRQLALHIASRDVPQFVGTEGRTASSARELVRKVADGAAAAAVDAARGSALRRDSLASDWEAVVGAAFRRGRQLPGAADA